ncbi:hypothetical protein GCM10022214_30650 [Actinomadura miaoliensis]|uniref:Uncharacterized protein n=1 Tax=Actinomadura miaoliensis TaxID=430685 RepID=A0ABP7VR03_9ACTN
MTGTLGDALEPGDALELVDVLGLGCFSPRSQFSPPLNRQTAARMSLVTVSGTATTVIAAATAATSRVMAM